ncbi:hypothetical protein F8S13_25620 [Chloroflexia bacterium SDU3-3]|nr:hypothetical protein F8S13_25620 [Chloroflexia bacterium SDU3-3]
MQQIPAFPWPTLTEQDSQRFARPPQIRLTLRHHCSPISALAIDRSETYLASADREGAVCLWELGSGRLVSSYRHDGGVFALAFGDQSRVVSGGADAAVRVWDYAAHALVCALPTPPHVGVVAIDPTYRYLAAGIHYANTIELWDWPSLQPIQTIKGDYYTFSLLGFDATGTALHVRLEHGENQIVSIPDGALRQSFKDEHLGEWSYSALSHDARMLATACECDDHVCIWDTQTGEMIQSIHVMFKGGPYDPNIALRPDGTILVSAALDEQIRVWQPNTGALLSSCPNQHDDEVCAMTMSSSHLITGDHDGIIQLWHFQ